jgi:hypothetical protein
MIDDLLKIKKISQENYDLYVLFQVNELGRKCLEHMCFEAFMDEPSDKEFSETAFAFYDGRRSVLRDIRRAILYVEQCLKELNHDGHQH